MEIYGYLASIFVGLILGILGGGGSILTIPILVYIFHLDVVTASAYSLFIVGITSLAGSIPKYKDHLVNLRTGILFGLPSIITIFITRKWIVPAIPEVLFDYSTVVLTKRMLLLGIFALLMILAAIAMLKEEKPLIHHEPSNKGLLISIEGSLIGFLTGLVGAGGGFLIIPALVLLTGLPFKTAVGTSLFIIAINSLMGFMGDVLNFQMDWIFLLTFTTLAVCGILIGTHVCKYISSAKLRRSFAWFVLIMGCWILIAELM